MPIAPFSLSRWRNVFLLGLLAGSLLLGLAACSSPPAAAPPAATAAGPAAAPAARPAAAGMAKSTSLVTFTSSHFAGSGVCVACHSPIQDQAGADVSPALLWRGSIKSNGAVDPVWQAKVSSEVKRFPGLQAIIEEKCATCHMPMASTETKAGSGKVQMLGQGFLDPKHPLHAAAMDGISCTLCHRIENKALGQQASFSGGYQVDTQAKAPNRPLYGAFQPQSGAVMQSVTNFNPMQGPQVTDAALCATCHNLYTPYVDAGGKVLGEFPEQMVYTEWQNSSFAAGKTTCQTCHMPAAKGAVAISTIPAGLPGREPFGRHEFAGGNAFTLAMLRDNGVELGVTADPEHFDRAIANVQEMLGKRTATLALKSLELKGDALTAQLQVTVLAGHKFPTSFPSRRAWLHVTVTDAAGKVIFESGQPKGDGTIAGNDADADPAKFEPHYDLITTAGQVQVYEPIMGDNEGKVTYTLLRGGQYLKDNRLLPAGFDKAKAPADVAVHGDAAADANFGPGGDLVTYQVDVKGATSPFMVSAELLFEPLSYQFIQDTLKDGTDLTNRLSKYYAAADKKPARIAAIEPAKTK